jgi:protein-disulfide isomerase
VSRESKFMVGFLVVAVVVLVGLFVINNKPTTPATATTSAAKVNGNELHKTGTGTKVTVVEFGDYQCPACSEVEPIIEKLTANYATKITFVFRNYPLSIHPNALAAAEAAEAASAQGKVWEMHNKLYAAQKDWADLSSADALNTFVGYAESLGLDTTKFKSDVTNKAYASIISADKADGDALTLSGTPSFFINNTIFKPGFVPTYDELTKAIDADLK